MNNNATGFYDQLWQSNWGDLQRYGPMHRHQNRMLRSLTSKLEWDTVLDVGCGAGQNLKRICEGRKCSRIVGVDISEHALGFALQNMPEAEFRVVDIEHELLDERFDLVLCIQVLEHIADDNALCHFMWLLYFLNSDKKGELEIVAAENPIQNFCASRGKPGIPVAWTTVEENRNMNILEVGNMLAHYFDVDHTVLDKYEKYYGVINE